jgi:hypothetical protein
LFELGIHKPFDRIAKEFADEAPLLFLRILGMVSAEDEIVLEPQGWKQNSPAGAIAGLRGPLSIGGAEAYVFHMECFVGYRSRFPAGWHVKPGVQEKGALRHPYQRSWWRTRRAFFCWEAYDTTEKNSSEYWEFRAWD